MGVMRFRTDPLDPAGPWPQPEGTYLVGFDGRVMATRCDHTASILECVRPTSDSGKVRTIWPVEGRGLTSLTTSSLRERDEPYNMAVELARGTLGELRNQAAVWMLGGMQIPESYRRAEAEAFGLFSRAACRQTTDRGEAARLAQQSIAAACRADDELLRSYTSQRLAMRRPGGSLPVVLGCGIQQVPEGRPAEVFDEAFAAASVAVCWRDVEQSVGTYDWAACDAAVSWASEHKLLVRGGPLLDFRENGLPEWLRQWSHDLPSLQSFLCDFVETAVARYRGQVKFWDVAVGSCPGGAFDIGEEERLALTARLIEAARRADDDSHVSLRVDEPWGQYQRHGQHRLTPMQFVDAIARSNLGLGMLNLQLDLMDETIDDGRRSLSEVSRLIDTWSLHGLPLHVTVRAEAAGGSDEDAALDRWLKDFLPLLMAKPTVTGVFWTQYSDQSGSPPAGVLDVEGQPKNTFQTFRGHRTQQQ